MNWETIKEESKKNLGLELYQSEERSAWVDYKSGDSRVKPLSDISDIKDNIAGWLSEMTMTTPAGQKEFVELLKIWLNENQLEDMLDERPKELRDFIYEMF